MLWWQVKERIIEGEYFSGYTCKNCKNKTHQAIGHLKYFTLYSIPVFPTSKTPLGMQCTSCKHGIEIQDLPEKIKNELADAIFTFKKIFTSFIGLIIIPTVIAFIMYSSGKQEDLELDYLKSPKVNDFYVINFQKLSTETKKNDPELAKSLALALQYGTAKVVTVKKNKVQIIISSVSYSKSSGARKDINSNKVNNNSYYSPVLLTYSTNELHALKKLNVISSVIRK